MSAVDPTFQLELPGLREDNPRDFLAALGLLRLLAAAELKSDPMLSWSKNGSPVFHLHSSLFDTWHTYLATSLKTLITGNASTMLDGAAHLQAWLEEEFSSSSQKFILNGTSINNTIFGAVSSIRADCVKYAFRNSLSHQESALRKISVSLVCSLLSQVHTSFDKKKKVLKSEISELSFANKQGQKYLLYGLQQAVREAFDFRNLCSTAPKKTTCQNFRWSPDEYRPSAYLGGSSEYLDVIEANVAAVIGMTFFPIVDQTERHLSGGFSQARKEDQCFRWPTWNCPLSVDPISTLLLSPNIHSTTKLDHFGIRQMGCRQLWSSRRFSADKSLYFAPAKPLL